jgi:hypothetical protein
MARCGPDRCFVGNGNMLMMETNSDETAGIVMAWLEQSGRSCTRNFADFEPDQ